MMTEHVKLIEFVTPVGHRQFPCPQHRGAETLPLPSKLCMIFVGASQAPCLIFHDCLHSRLSASILEAEWSPQKKVWTTMALINNRPLSVALPQTCFNPLLSLLVM